MKKGRPDENEIAICYSSSFNLCSSELKIEEMSAIALLVAFRCKFGLVDKSNVIALDAVQ